MTEQSLGPTPLAQSLQERPDRPTRRIASLDVLRGIAILGTLASNIWIFAIPIGGGANTISPQAIADIAHWLPNGKFLGLLTVMFGIGLEIQRQAALRAGRRWPGTYPVRAALLFLDGLLNYIFIVPFDVLRAYAVTGLIVAFLLLTSERVQWWLIGVMIPLHLTVMAIQAAGFPSATSVDTVTSTSTAPVTGTGYGNEVLFNLTHLEFGFGTESEFFTIVLMGIGLFLLGAKLYRIGVFEPRRRILRYWLIGVAVVVGIPLDAVLTFSSLSESIFSGHARYGAAAVVALGILAAVAEFYQRRDPGRIGRQLSLVGKMALSCYLLQNIIGALFQRTAAGSPLLAGLDNTLGTIAMFLLISIVLVVFAHLWLRRFRRGPFEAAWDWCFRKLTRTTSTPTGN